MTDIQQKIQELKAAGKEMPAPEMIKNAEQIDKIRLAGKLNTAALDLVAKNIKIGIKTEELDRLVYEFLIQHGGRPADLAYMGYPKSICTSVNDEICHGVPNDYALKNGDIVNVDITTELNGYYADASRMFIVGRANKRATDLVNITRECLKRGIAAAQAWANVGDIGAAVSAMAYKHGYSIMKEYGGHGVGIEMHEDPFICHVGKKGQGMVLVPGMIITVEPMINEGTDEWYEDTENGWTVYTADGKLSAQWENTILITEHGPEILTE
ncbi:MAG: type I methionyl aminopeptidase [Phascolarctobacterium sp.]|nr:type I methionyl aminopeptidase [Candidatus Phascolarctobacterium caballi]